MPPHQAHGASPVTLEALFIPKLQRYFAEFLNHSSLTRLGLLDLSTCVGLGYGQQENSLEAFLGSRESMTSSERLGIVSQASWGPDLPGPRPTHFPQDNQRLGSPIFLRHSIANRLIVGRFAYPKASSLLATTNWFGRAPVGTGISTSCASTTPLGLALAPD